MENQFVIYQTDNGQTAIDVRMENETVWLTQAQMAQLFQKDRTVIGRHIRNVFKEGELDEKVVCAKFAHTTRHGAVEDLMQIKEVVLYNLDVIISVGYRVKSQRGVQFRHPVVPQQQRHPLSRGRRQAHRRQHFGRTNLDDCREQTRRKGRDG